MCLIVFAHQVNAHIPLAVAANRDEFHQRASAHSKFWGEYPHVLAGRDLELGGTWLGTTRGGRFAAVTNFRDPAQTTPAARSRGALPLDFLLGTETPEQYLSTINHRAAQYAGFNLLVGMADELWYLSNNPGDEPMSLAPGVYGLSNARLDTPWPKAQKGKEKMARLLSAGEISHAALVDIVSDTTLTDRKTLDDGSPASAMDHLLSGQFIVGEHYGTRCTTTLWKTVDSEMHWQELSFDAQGRVNHTHNQRFDVISTN